MTCTVNDNLREVQNRISDACKKSGRDNSSVCLIAVSKTKSNDVVMEAYNAGVRIFGENYVQELCDKIDSLPNDIQWHMIGHLQRNKVKYIVGKVAMIHSVDSIRLAEEISKESLKRDIITDILVEVNVALEENKFGFTVEEVEKSIRLMAHMKGIRVKGLMTSAPYVKNAEQNREIFRKLKQLCVDINNENIDNVHMDVLSMGMTNDYTVAIEEGATYVRVGTAIFGARDYNK